MFEEQERPVKDPNYSFCPAPHRRGVLKLLMKHFLQHPLLPDQYGRHSPNEIYEKAVFEMYLYCTQRGLTETWAYMWTSWYQPRQWKNWARSASKRCKLRLDRVRTTMMAENFHRQLKHHFLHDYHRPRLDHMLYILVTHIIPSYMQRAAQLEDTYRLGRAKPLTARQKYVTSSS